MNKIINIILVFAAMSICWYTGYEVATRNSSVEIAELKSQIAILKKKKARKVGVTKGRKAIKQKKQMIEWSRK